MYTSAAVAFALSLSTSASAYPSSVIYAPSGEALPFGSFALGAYAGLGLSPDVAFGSGWGGLNIGVVPSIDIANTPAGKIAFAGAEIGFDVFGPDEVGEPRFVLNAKVQLLKDSAFIPAIAIGFFQISPDPGRSAMLGYFSLSKSITIRDIEFGQVTFGMMRSFAGSSLIAPQCFVSGAPACLFRGAAPFEDQNGAFLAGYLSPWFGPVGFSIDHVGGTSAVSSTNLAVNFRFWQDDTGGFAFVGLGGFISNDRRDSPPGPGATDGVFIQAALISSLAGLFGWDPTSEWSKDPRKPRSRRGRRDVEDPFEAPELKPPEGTPDPSEPKK